MAVDEQLALGRTLLNQQQTEERRFAGAARPRQKNELAFFNCEGKILQCVQTATVEFREVLRLDHAACAPGAKGLLVRLDAFSIAHHGR